MKIERYFTLTESPVNWYLIWYSRSHTVINQSINKSINQSINLLSTYTTTTIMCQLPANSSISYQD